MNLVSMLTGPFSVQHAVGILSELRIRLRKRKKEMTLTPISRTSRIIVVIIFVLEWPVIRVFSTDLLKRLLERLGQIKVRVILYWAVCNFLDVIYFYISLYFCCFHKELLEKLLVKQKVSLQKIENNREKDWSIYSFNIYLRAEYWEQKVCCYASLWWHSNDGTLFVIRRSQ